MKPSCRFVLMTYEQYPLKGYPKIQVSQQPRQIGKHDRSMLEASVASESVLESVAETPKEKKRAK